MRRRHSFHFLSPLQNAGSVQYPTRAVGELKGSHPLNAAVTVSTTGTRRRNGERREQGRPGGGRSVPADSGPAAVKGSLLISLLAAELFSLFF